MLKFIARLFEGSVDIERTYGHCDQAIGLLQSYNENPDEFSEKKKTNMDETVEVAIREATNLISLEGEKNWIGVFREMHSNLASIHLELGDRDKVDYHCKKLAEYGEPGRLDAEEILEKLDQAQSDIPSTN